MDAHIDQALVEADDAEYDFIEAQYQLDDVNERYDDWLYEYKTTAQVLDPKVVLDHDART